MQPFSILSAASAALIGLGIAQAAAEPFTLLIFEQPAQLALREAKTPEGAAYWTAWASAGKVMADAGIVRGGSALSTRPAVGRVGGAAAAVGKTLDPEGLSLGGYFQIDVADEDAALEWAAKLPVGAGLVEVRAGYPVPGMM